MGWFNRLITSTIGRKILMAFTGLFLCTFLIVHLIGNFQLFKNDGGEAFNAYSHFMSTNILIRTMEIGLGLGFFFHIYSAVVLWFRNRQARPVGYKKNDASENSTFFSRTMIWSGGLILAFLIIHLIDFFVEHRIIGTDESMYDGVMEAFNSAPMVWFYVLAFVLLGFHLAHGFQSGFQTLGLNHKKYTPIIKFLGTAYSILVPLGYAVIALYFLYVK